MDHTAEWDIHLHLFEHDNDTTVAQLIGAASGDIAAVGGHARRAGHRRARRGQCQHTSAP